MAGTDILIEKTTIISRDGYELSAFVVAPERPKAAVLISSGTGFPKEFYRRIAEHGAARGYACLLYDYRGIAGSAPKNLRGFKADMTIWGRRDMTAAIDAASALAPTKPLYTLGHSVGGHLIGFAANSDKANAHAFINVGSGYWGKHAASYKLQALFFWLIYGPLCLASLGYIPGGGLWGGTALPRNVYTQWRRWCFKPDYYGDELDSLLPNWFHDVREPIRAWGMTDDPIANPSTTSDILAFYKRADTSEIWLTPEDLDQDKIGHQGLFTRKGEAFWPMPFDWFDSLMNAGEEIAP